MVLGTLGGQLFESHCNCSCKCGFCTSTIISGVVIAFDYQFKWGRAVEAIFCTLLP